ncbi:DUF4158 domain-containing protein [Enterobacter kobei]|uniref:DUF4158 domain-containing protein n=1 Tax=Enterobacter kobei TaxID=208224 RepID=UPI00388DEDDA
MRCRKADDLIRYYTFNDSDLSLIRQRRGDANRLGFAVQLCLLRYPGYALGTDSELPERSSCGWRSKSSRAGELGKVRRARRDPSRACPNCAPTCNWPRSACPTSAPWCAS